MEYKALKEIAKITMGQSPDSSSYNEDGDGMPFFQGNADFGEIYPNERIWCNDPKKTAEPGDILISVRAPIGALNYAKDRCCIGRGLAAITIDDEAERNYVFHLLKAKNSDLNNQGTGSTFKAIGKAVLEDVQVPQISREEQQKCMDMMDLLESIIRERRAQLSSLDELIKARFVELFGNPVINDKGWNTDSCKNLMSKIGSGATPKGGRESYCDEGISLIRSMNVYNNRFEYKDLAHITDEQAKQLDNVTIEKSDVLLNITGASVARCCVVPDDLLPARVNQHVSIIRCKKSLLPEFVCSMFTEDNYQRLLWNIATAGGATREAITKQQIEELKLIVPPIDLQKQFMDFVKQIDKSKFDEMSEV
ncbi:type I restriction enzyme, S subunit [Eubacterium ruminantium]|uniref:Type I restriction enzyme, S subunit n=1 Tax=Eubacterium ruminantium TaxID=42322 RepID=A0A1T4KS81_9FIRM|nr:restriction endonuclease subunit S [Eubacterium ruminantium]SCW34371.1 type I restriction enzyme, S subunit [Eubacterium ruminantium]SDM32860.1 type I restriction enzyme, S subunit [Eubacterium ruminantium]SJZ45299.1 type I restriction enzyme, S subunit [Eubacterium ruminantium]